MDPSRWTIVTRTRSREPTRDCGCLSDVVIDVSGGLYVCRLELYDSGNLDPHMHVHSALCELGGERAQDLMGIAACAQEQLCQNTGQSSPPPSLASSSRRRLCPAGEALRSRSLDRRARRSRPPLALREREREKERRPRSWRSPASAPSSLLGLPSFSPRVLPPRFLSPPRPRLRRSERPLLAPAPPPPPPPTPPTPPPTSPPPTSPPPCPYPG